MTYRGRDWSGAGLVIVGLTVGLQLGARAYGGATVKPGGGQSALLVKSAGAVHNQRTVNCDVVLKKPILW